jgi:hypothetical protein
LGDSDWTPEELEALTCKVPGCGLLICLDSDLCPHHAEQRRQRRLWVRLRRRVC